MPTLLGETQVSLDKLDLAKRSPVKHPNVIKGKIQQPARAKGTHLSGILRYIAVTSKMVDWQAQSNEEELPLRMALGLAWEEFAVSLYPEIVWQPGEEILDGVAMNADGFSIDYMEEFKLTWLKKRTGKEIISERWHWMCQVKGYCAGYCQRRVRLHVCYINGDYKPQQPIYMRYLIEFSQKEIEDNWKMVVMNRDRAKEAGYGE